MSNSARRSSLAVVAAASATGNRDALVSVALAVFVLLLLACLRPFTGAPQNDDFSYARTAWAFAQTGRLVYNGWASPLLLPQTVMGAITLKATGGFSYLPLALIGAACAGGAASAFYRLARVCGLSEFLSVFAVAVLVLNPVFLGVAPTFMTDAPSLLLYLLALYFLTSALRTGATENQITLDTRRFCFSIIFALIGGMNRQIVWVAELGALAFLFLALRSSFGGEDGRRNLHLLAGGAGLLLVAGGALSLWFAHAPYTVAPDVTGGLAFARAFPLLSVLSIYKLLNLLALGLAPVLLLALGRRRPYRGLLVFALGVFALALTFAVRLVAGPGGANPADPLADWFRLTVYGQYFTSHGALVGGVHGFDARPPAWGGSVSRLLTVLGAVCLTFSGALLFSWWDGPQNDDDADAPLRRTRVSVVAVASVAQIVVSLPWYAGMTVLDRYLLLLWPGLLILHLAQAGGRARVLPRPLFALTLVLALIWAGWGVASSQEYFAYTQARAALYRRLEARGVPRTAIDGGFEWNADTQVAAEGYINSDQIKNPPGAFRSGARGGVTYRPELFPALNARYLLSTAPAPPDGFGPSPLPGDTENYVSLLPPFRRVMRVYRLAGVGDADGADSVDGAPAPFSSEATSAP